MAAQDKGVEISIAEVMELHPKANGTWEVVATSDQGEKISYSATDVVFAAGPWTGRLAKKLLGKKAGVASQIVERYDSYIMSVTTSELIDVVAIARTQLSYAPHGL